MTRLQQLKTKQRQRGMMPQTKALRTQYNILNADSINAYNTLNSRVQTEATRLSNIDMTKYREEYGKIPKDLKQYFPLPNEIEGTTEYKDYVQQINTYNQKLNNYGDYKKGFNLAFSDNPSAVFAVPQNKYGLKGYQDARSYINYNDKLIELGKLGIKPIYNDGKLAGFDDSSGNVSYSPQYLFDYHPELKSTFKDIIKPDTIVYNPTELKQSVTPFYGPVPKGYSEEQYRTSGKLVKTNSYEGYPYQRQQEYDFNKQAELYGKDMAYSDYIDVYSKKYLPRYVEQVPIIAKDIVMDTGKGGLNLGLRIGEKATGYSLPDDDILKKWSEYNREVPFYLDPKVQTWGLTTGFVGLGALASGTGKIAQGARYGLYGAEGGVIGYQGYSTLKSPTDRNVAMLGTMVLLPEITKRGMKSVRVRNGYKIALRDLEVKFGKASPEVIQFKAMWKRAFKELPRNTPILKEWTSKKVKMALGDKKISKITDKIMKKYNSEIIGSTVIEPQTTLKKLPRVLGDVDVQNVPVILGKGSRSKYLAEELYSSLKKEGYNVRLRKNKFKDGTTKYHITKDGKEFVNIGTSSDYFIKTQAGPIINWYELENIGAWNKQGNLRLGNIRDQLRVKLWKGFVEKTRPKDILDSKAIMKGTDYLFKNKFKRLKDVFNESKVSKIYEGKKTSQYDLYKYSKGYYGRGIGGGYNYGYNKKQPYKYDVPKTPPNMPPYSPPPEIPEIPPYQPPQYPPYTPYYPPELYTGVFNPYIPYKGSSQKSKKVGGFDFFSKFKAYQPILITMDGKRIPLEYYKTKYDAFKEGANVVDETPFNKFMIRRVNIDKDETVRSIRKTIPTQKFKQRGGVYIEKTPYRKDKGSEKWKSYRMNSHSLTAI